MKKLGFIALICVVNSVFAIDATFKARICNYTLSNIDMSILDVAGLTINNVRYTDYTDAKVDKETIGSKQCQDMPVITAQGVHDVPAFMSIFIVKNPDTKPSSVEYFSVFNLQNRQSVLEPKTMITSFNILPEVQSENINVFLHAKNNMLSSAIDYYDISTLGHYADHYGNKYFQNLGGNYNYDFEFYICDVAHLEPCQTGSN
ncbi:MAG: hypothetical protein LW807_02625 [Proteobacteria bacterium]|nr:hypothetical protein [Pseudomonadota bacterium]